MSNHEVDSSQGLPIKRWTSGVPVETFTIITTEANQLAKRLNDGMPVILAPNDYEARLGENTVREVAELLRP